MKIISMKFSLATLALLFSLTACGAASGKNEASTQGQDAPEVATKDMVVPKNTTVTKEEPMPGTVATSADEVKNANPGEEDLLKEQLSDLLDQIKDLQGESVETGKIDAFFANEVDAAILAAKTDYFDFLTNYSTLGDSIEASLKSFHEDGEVFRSVRNSTGWSALKLKYGASLSSLRCPKELCTNDDERAYYSKQVKKYSGNDFGSFQGLLKATNIISKIVQDLDDEFLTELGITYSAESFMAKVEKMYEISQNENFRALMEKYVALEISRSTFPGDESLRDIRNKIIDTYGNNGEIVWYDLQASYRIFSRSPITWSIIIKAVNYMLKIDHTTSKTVIDVKAEDDMLVGSEVKAKLGDLKITTSGSDILEEVVVKYSGAANTDIIDELIIIDSNGQEFYASLNEDDQAVFDVNQSISGTSEFSIWVSLMDDSGEEISNNHGLSIGFSVTSVTMSNGEREVLLRKLADHQVNKNIP